jgi:MFS family permease
MTVIRALRLSRAPVLPFMVMGAGWGTFASYAPELKAGLGANDALFGMLILCSSLGLVTSMWLAPRIDERLGPLALPFACGAMAVAFLLPALAPAPLAFAAAMVLLGAGSGLTDVIMNARVSELEARHGTSLMNVNHAMFSFVYAFAALVCSASRSAGLPPVAILALVTIGGLAATPLMRGKLPVDAAEPAPAQFPGSLVLWGGLIVLVGFMIENATEAWSALHIERTLGGGAAQGAFGPMVLGLTMGIGRLSGQLIAGRWREPPVLVAASLLSCAGLLLAAAAPSPAFAYLGFGLSGLGVSVIAPMALALVGRGVSDRHRTVAIARASVIGFLGFFVGPMLIGQLSEAFGLRAALAVAALALLAVPPMLRLMRSTSSAPRNPPAPAGYRGSGH